MKPFSLPSTASKLVLLLQTIGATLGAVPMPVAVAAAAACTRGSAERLLVRTLTAVDAPELRELTVEVRSALAAYEPRTKQSGLNRSERARLAAQARWSRQAAGVLPGLPAVSFEELPEQLVAAPKMSRSEAARKAALARWARFERRACGTLPHVSMLPAHGSDALSDARSPALPRTYASADAKSAPHATNASANAQNASIPSTYACVDAKRVPRCERHAETHQDALASNAAIPAHSSGTGLALGSEDQIKRIFSSDSDPSLTGSGPRGSEGATLVQVREADPERAKRLVPVTRLPAASEHGLMECPESLRLSEADRSNLEMGRGYHPHRILELETRFVAQYGATGERRTAQQWQRRLWGFICSAGTADRPAVGVKPAEAGVERMACPDDLRMTDRQRASIMERLGYSFDRIVHLEGVYRVRYGLASSDEVTLEEWRRRLSGFVIKAGKADRVMTLRGEMPGKPAVFEVKEPRPAPAPPSGPLPQRMTEAERAAALEQWKKPYVAESVKPAETPATSAIPQADLERLRRVQEEARRRFAAMADAAKAG